jgi:hypothetical protein
MLAGSTGAFRVVSGHELQASIVIVNDGEFVTLVVDPKVIVPSIVTV